MKKTLLIFPDTASMAEFILDVKLSNVEVNSATKSLSAIVTEDEVVIASTRFGATLQSMTTLSYLPLKR